MKFTKMHGLGNDYIVIDGTREQFGCLSDLAARLCERRFGIGADGLIVVLPSEIADFRMRIFNADGSEGAMCGNGIRCAACFIQMKGLSSKRRLEIETMSGIREIICSENSEDIIVNMGKAIVFDEITITVKGMNYTGNAVSLGNPHFVIPVPEPAEIDLLEVRKAVKVCPRLEGEMNIEIVRATCSGRAVMRVWERGVGETLACGTGACAAFAVLNRKGLLADQAIISLPGGELNVTLRNIDGDLLMTGPVRTVFHGEIL